MKELLIKLAACEEATEWAVDKSWEEVYATCHRGDWTLWLFQRTNPDNLQLLTLAKGHCANTVRHLMKDERSIKAVDSAIAFGEGKITKEELDAAATAASDAARAAADAVTACAADVRAATRTNYYAAWAAADSTAADAAWSTAADAAHAAAWAAAVADDIAYEANQKLTADICRKYLPMEIWNVK
jgi:hypothetical protein